MEPLLVLVEMGFTVEGEQALREVLPRMDEELRSIPGMLEYRVYQRPERMYLFYTVWEDRDAVDRWYNNEFHKSVLIPGFRKWATEGVFDYWDLRTDNPRARKCPACGRWTQEKPGWSAQRPTTCSRCGAALAGPVVLEA